MSHTFWLVLQIFTDSTTLWQFAEQQEALRRYQKCVHAILYELTVGAAPSLREALRKELEEESEAQS